MDTTGISGRQDRECADESTTVRSTLKHARRIFADLAKAMEAETDRLQFSAATAETEDRLKIVNDLMSRLQKASQQVIDIELRLMKTEDAAVPGRNVIDLEAARAEIARRLDRLAA